MPLSILSLHFSVRSPGGQTTLQVKRQDPPWRALRAFSNSSGEALVHLHNLSGGILGGDNLKLEVTLTPNAQAQITNIGATRVYRHRAGQPAATHTTTLHLGANALLEYLPEPLIPFAHSRYSQTSEIHLAEGAGLIYWETLSAGRIARGESFDFENVSVNTAIHTPTGAIALERYSLSPNLQKAASPSRMGPLLYSATMYVCRADGSARWLALESELNTIARALSGPETLWGASSLVHHGVVIRGMARHAHQITAGLQCLWQAAKQFVWRRPALLPRKIY